MDALLASGERLRRVQRRLLEGKANAQSLAGARAEERKRAGALMRGAQRLLREAGHASAGAAVEQVQATLQALPSVSEADRERLLRGRLTAPLEAPADLDALLGGFGAATPATGAAREARWQPREANGKRGSASPPPHSLTRAPARAATPAKARTKAKGKAGDGAARAADEAQRATARAAVAAAAQFRRRAAQDLAEARRRAERVREERERAARFAKKADAELTRARDHAAAAREGLAEVEASLREAEAAVREREARAAGVGAASNSVEPADLRL